MKSGTFVGPDESGQKFAQIESVPTMIILSKMGIRRRTS